MPEFTNQGNVKITDGAAPGEKRLDVDTQASLQVLEVLTDQVDAETVDVNVLNANLIREGGARVVESGSNANGEYVRFADGTQVCYARNALAFGSGTAAWVYPAAFSAVPSVVGIGRRDDSVSVSVTTVSSGTNATQATFARLTSSSVDSIAIGRWK